MHTSLRRQAATVAVVGLVAIAASGAALAGGASRVQTILRTSAWAGERLAAVRELAAATERCD